MFECIRKLFYMHYYTQSLRSIRIFNNVFIIIIIIILKENNTFVEQESIILIRRDFCNVSNKQNPEQKVSWFPQKYEAAQLFP